MHFSCRTQLEILEIVSNQFPTFFILIQTPRLSFRNSIFHSTFQFLFTFRRFRNLILHIRSMAPPTNCPFFMIFNIRYMERIRFTLRFILSILIYTKRKTEKRDISFWSKYLLLNCVIKRIFLLRL